MIRHPLSDANAQGIVYHNQQGGIDPRGYEQIEKLLHRLNGENFDRIYSSDAYRCRILAERIAEQRGVKVIYHPLFVEINNGDWHGKTKEEIEKRLQADPLNTRPPNGESLRDLADRAEEARKFILAEGGERNVLISHARFMKMFLGIQIGLNPIQALNHIKFSNCAISEIRISDGECMIEYLNNRDYLQK